MQKKKLLKAQGAPRSILSVCQRYQENRQSPVYNTTKKVETNDSRKFSNRGNQSAEASVGNGQACILRLTSVEQPFNSVCLDTAFFMSLYPRHTKYIGGI